MVAASRFRLGTIGSVAIALTLSLTSCARSPRYKQEDNMLSANSVGAFDSSKLPVLPFSEIRTDNPNLGMSGQMNRVKDVLIDEITGRYLFVIEDSPDQAPIVLGGYKHATEESILFDEGIIVDIPEIKSFSGDYKTEDISSYSVHGYHDGHVYISARAGSSFHAEDSTVKFSIGADYSLDSVGNQNLYIEDTGCIQDCTYLWKDESFAISASSKHFRNSEGRGGYLLVSSLEREFQQKFNLSFPPLPQRNLSRPEFVFYEDGFLYAFHIDIHSRCKYWSLRMCSVVFSRFSMEEENADFTLDFGRAFKQTFLEKILSSEKYFIWQDIYVSHDSHRIYLVLGMLAERKGFFPPNYHIESAQLWVLNDKGDVLTRKKLAESSRFYKFHFPDGRDSEETLQIISDSGIYSDVFVK